MTVLTSPIKIKLDFEAHPDLRAKRTIEKLLELVHRYGYSTTVERSIGGEWMSAVRLSPKFQVVIPKEVREELDLKAGQKMEVLQYENRIELIPIRPLRKMRGFLKGIDTTVQRDPDRV